MKERPILFSGEMVKAILDGRKAQTRRVVKHKRELPPSWATFVQEISSLNMRLETYPSGLFQWACAEDEGVQTIRRWPSDWIGHCAIPSPYGGRKDHLWVRETWNYAQRHGYDAPQDGRPGTGDDQSRTCPIWYRASDSGQVDGPWRPSIFMPRWASRITLEITDVRVQRLQDISEEDAEAEGAEWYGVADLQPNGELREGESVAYRAGFHDLWDSINAKRGFGWDVNPWVWAITFKRVAQ